MYLKYWSLHAHPFVNTPNRKVFFQSPQHEEAIHRLLYVIRHRGGVAMISGEVGCGKTTLVRALNNFLPDHRYEMIFIPNPAVSPADLLRAVIFRLGENISTDSKAVLLDRFQRLLEMRARQEKDVVLVIDEAHMIQDNETLNELRMMLNFQTEDRGLITMLLLGQPPLLKKMAQLHPLNERIGMKIQLQPLDLKNTGRYLLFRLRKAGTGHGIFSKEAVGEIYAASGGIPLRINNVADRCLVIGMMKKARLVTVAMVREAIADLG